MNSSLYKYLFINEDSITKVPCIKGFFKYIKYLYGI